MIGSHLLAALGDGAVAVPRGLIAGEAPAALADWLATAGVDLLVNAVGTAGRPWAELHQANTVLAGHLARAADRAAVGCVYLGSTRVFDPARPGARQETEAVDPADDYGRSKALGEDRVREQLEGGRYFILRLPMFLGLRERNMDGQIATRLLARAWKGERVRVAADAYTQAVCAKAVTAAVLALREGGLPSGTYHLPSANHASLHAIMARLFAGCGLPLPEQAASRDFDPAGPGPRWQVLAPGRLTGRVSLVPWELAVDQLVQALARFRRHG